VKTKMTTILVLLMVVITFGQNQLPPDGLQHHFKFDDSANLETPEIGNPLQRDALAGVTQLFNSVSGPTGTNKAVEVGLGSFYRLDLDLEANGPDTATRVNQFSLVIDFYLPVSSVWYTFHAASNDGDPIESDWESFVNTAGSIGVFSTGYTTYKALSNEWHRLVISADLGNSYNYYIDGQLARIGGALEVDGRFSLPTIDGANQILLFGDNDGDDANIYIAELGIYNRALTSQEIFTLGGYGHSIPLEIPYGSWKFDNPDSLTKPTYGNELELVGTHTAVEGPDLNDGAVRIGVGSHYIAHHDLVPRTGEDRVNLYTLLIDFKVANLGAWYSFFQTDPANTTDAELFINPAGNIGVNDFGYTDTSIVAGDWYRLVITADLGTAVKFYLDGDSIHFGGAQEIDGRFSISPRSLDNKLLLFGDNDGDDGIIDIAKITLYNRVLTTEEINELGGYEHGPENTEVTGALKTVYFNGNDVNNRYGKVLKSNDDFNFGEGDFTIEVWTKPDLFYNEDPALISDKNWEFGTNPGWVISIRGDDWKFNAADQNGNRCDATGPKINDGNWHHLTVIAKQDSGLKLITDNVETIWLAVPELLSMGDINTTYPLCIAQDGTEDYVFTTSAPAQVDEIRIWKGVAVDPQVIFDWRNKELNTNHPNWSSLVGYWVFNEGSGSTVADLSGHNNSMELIGGPRWEVSYAAIGNETAKNMLDVNAIWGGATESNSSGLSLTGSFPFPILLAAPVKTQDVFGTLAKEDNPFIVFGHNGFNNVVTGGVSGSVVARLGRTWYLDRTETAVADVNATFDISDFGGTGNAGDAAGYVLLSSQEQNGAYTEVVTSTVSVSGDHISFPEANVNDGYYTLGTKNLTTSPLGGLTVGIDDESIILPKEFNLSQNYPNPFNPTTKINFSLPIASYVELTVFNILGEVIEVLVNRNLNAGYHSINWNADNFSSGMYIYKIKAVATDGKEFIKTQKMMLLK